MILTLTPNPSLDTTIELPCPLTPGDVHRASGGHTDPGGKGVNISRALAASGAETLALLPGDPGDPMLTALEHVAVPHQNVPIGAPLRTNVTVTDPAGTTTKINEAGPAFTRAAAETLIELINYQADHAWWVALAGSLPPGTPADFYAQIIHRVRDTHDAAPRIAVDASGDALIQAVSAGPDLIKPNAEELIELHRSLYGIQSTDGITSDEVEADADLAARLVQQLQPCGVRAALVTLGARGAVYIPAPAPEDDQPVLRATGPPLAARSTVGAGDAALAGFLIAASARFCVAECLRHAMAHGRAAATLPGSTMPAPENLRLGDVVVDELNSHIKDIAE